MIEFLATFWGQLVAASIGLSALVGCTINVLKLRQLAAEIRASDKESRVIIPTTEEIQKYSRNIYVGGAAMLVASGVLGAYGAAQLSQDRSDLASVQQELRESRNESDALRADLEDAQIGIANLRSNHETTLAEIEDLNEIIDSTAQSERLFVGRVEADGSMSHKILVPADMLTLVSLVGDGVTDLDLLVYDEDGILVAQDTDSSDETIVNLSNASKGIYTIEIRNLGPVWSKYFVRVAPSSGSDE